MEIGGKSGNTDQALVPALSPFETEEDTSDDWFTPVRLQSGYIRVVGNNWDLMPTTATNRPVTLTRTDDDTVLWRGYIKMYTYQGGVYDDYQVREYPVVCQLSVLESFEAIFDNVEMPNFAAILNTCLSDGSWGNIYWQGDDAYSDWLRKRVSEACLLERSDRNQVTWKYNKLQLLEEVCKFFGVTARTFGNDLYFCAADWNEDFYQISFSGLASIANGYAVSPTEVQYDVHDADDIFTDTESQELYVSGIRKATVTADPNENDILVDYPSEDFERKVTQFSQRPASTSSYGSLYVFKNYGVSPPLVNMNSKWTWDEVSSTPQYCRPECVDTYDGSLVRKHNYSWTYYFGLECSTNYELVIETHDSVVLYDGVLALTGDVSFVNYSSSGGGSESVHNAAGTMQVSLEVGGMWYDQVNGYWQYYEVWNTVNIGDELGAATGMGKILTNRALDSSVDPNYSGWGFHTRNAPACGKLKLKIKNVALTGWDGQPHQIRFQNLQLKFWRNASTWRDKSMSYSASNNVAYQDEVSVDVAFASDNANYYGSSIICDYDGTYCSALTYGNTSQRPEQWLANRIAAFGAGRRELLVYNINVDDVGGDITPATKLNADSIGRYPYSVSVRWADDVATVRMTEV